SSLSLPTLATTAWSWRRIAADIADISSAAGGSVLRNSSVSTTAPMGRLQEAWSLAGVPTMIWVEPPPISIPRTCWARETPEAPRKESRASSSPLRMRISSPASRAQRSTKARPFFAARSARVPTACSRSAPRSSATKRSSESAVIVRSAASGEISPDFWSPSPSRVIIERWSSAVTRWPETRPTSSFTEFVPMSMAARVTPGILRHRECCCPPRGSAIIAAVKITLAGLVLAAALALLVVLYHNARTRGLEAYCRNNLRQLGTLAWSNRESVDPSRTGRDYWQAVREAQYRDVRGKWQAISPDPFLCPVLGSTVSNVAEKNTIDYRGPVKVREQFKE